MIKFASSLWSGLYNWVRARVGSEGSIVERNRFLSDSSVLISNSPERIHFLSLPSRNNLLFPLHFSTRATIKSLGIVKALIAALLFSRCQILIYRYNPSFPLLSQKPSRTSRALNSRWVWRAPAATGNFGRWWRKQRFRLLTSTACCRLCSAATFLVA